MLRNQPGIRSVKVALLAERGVVEYDPQLWTVEKIVEVSLFLFVLLQAHFISELLGNIGYRF